MTNFDLRDACSDDALDIQAIYAPIVEETAISFEIVAPSVEEISDRIQAYSLSHAYRVAVREKRVIGYAYGSIHRTREAYRPSTEVTVYVAKTEQGKGVGSALYSDLFPRLKNKGFHAAFAAITLPNLKSVTLHEAVGFTHVGIFKEVGRKFDTWHDVGWWQKIL